MTGNAQALSADGRYVAYSSDSGNLVSGDSNSSADVFVFDRKNRTTDRVSVASDGTQGDGSSNGAAISADGRFVAYFSFASTLVTGDTNGAADVFVFDRQNRTTTRVSVASDGTQSNDHSWRPTISGDGRFVTYSSDASTLVDGDTNTYQDVFVFDRVNHTTSLVSIASDGTQGLGPSANPAISADGHFISFTSEASNLVSDDNDGFIDLFVSDQVTHTTTRVSVAQDGTGLHGYFLNSAISADGRYVVADGEMPRGNPERWDVFLFDRLTGESTRVSVAPDGTWGNGYSWQPAISADGRYVAYSSLASNLVQGDTRGVEDVLVFDRVNHTTSRVSVSSDGSQGIGPSTAPAISATGRYVTYTSESPTLVPNDTNAVSDVFFFDRRI